MPLDSIEIPESAPRPKPDFTALPEKSVSNIPETITTNGAPAMRTNPPPPDWGRDELTKFLQETHQQQYATFHNKRAGRLIAIDSLFCRVSKHWLNPQSEVAAMLFLRCHAALRAAAGEAMAGQVVESYRQSRGMMENAAYCLHINRNPELARVWLDRHVDKASLKASRDAFLHGALMASVKAANVHAAERFEQLYQRTIDFGGHPNERSVTGSMKMVERPDRREMLAVMLHDDDTAFKMGLKSVAQCAMVSLEILQAVFKARFELIGVNADMLELRKGL